MTERYELLFRCDGCGEPLPTEPDEKGFVWCNEYHDCFGEEVGCVAMASDTGVTVNRDGISLEFDV